MGGSILRSISQGKGICRTGVFNRMNASPPDGRLPSFPKISDGKAAGV